MRFSGMQSSDYSRAGKAVAADFEKSLDAARTYSPKADDLVIAADTIRAKEKIAANKIKGEVTARGIRAAASVKSEKMDIQGKQKVRKAKRKAGVLAAGGKLVGEGGSLLGEEPRDKRTVGEGSEAIDKLIEENEKKAGELRTQAEEVDLTGGFVPQEVPASSNTSGSASNTGSGDNTNSNPSSNSSSNTAGTSNTSRSNLQPHQVKGLKAIREVESGPYGYEAYNLGGKTEFDPIGSGSASDGRYGKKLTEMTIGEIKALGNSGKIHATGAYQFTHNTGSFGEAASFAGLSDNDLFTPANQDRMALAFGQRYGWERWSGLKKDPGRASLAQAGFQ